MAAGFLSERGTVEISLGVRSQAPRRFGPAKPPSTKKTPSRVSFTGCDSWDPDPPCMLTNDPCHSSTAAGGLTSVLSPNDDPLDVMRRLDPGRIVFQKAWTFLMRSSILMRSSKPNGKSTEGFVPGEKLCGKSRPFLPENDQIYAIDAIATCALLSKMADPLVSCSAIRLIASFLIGRDPAGLFCNLCSISASSSKY